MRLTDPEPPGGGRGARLPGTAGGGAQACPEPPTVPVSRDSAITGGHNDGENRT